MQKKKYKFNQVLQGMPPGFIMGDIKGVIMHPDNDVSEQGCIISSGDEFVVVMKDGELDSKSSGIMSIPSNEVWFQTQNGVYQDPMYVQVEEEYGDTFPDLPTFDREKTQAANTGSGHIYKWVFTGDVTRINDGSTGMFTEDGYYSAALPISKVFLPITYWQTRPELEPSLFAYCSYLESFTIPNSVTSIGSQAFWKCSSLTSITIPNSVTSIGSSAFESCSALTSVTIGNGVTTIGDYAFYRCSSLTSVTIPNSVTSIREAAFSGCASLISITLGSGVTSLGFRVFNDNPAITSIVVDANNPKYDSRYNCNAIIETLTGTLIAGCQNTIIPNDITSIGREAFYYCSTLTSITIPNSVTSIGYAAFQYCPSLTSIVIPDSVTSIGGSAFSSCNSLTSITCEATTPPTLGAGNNLSNVTAVYVPAESVNLYKQATNWSYYSNIITSIPS